MSTESQPGGVTPGTGSAPVNGATDGAGSPSAASGVTADLKNEIQRIVMGVVREHMSKAVKAAVGEAFAGDGLRGAIESVLEAMADASPEGEPSAPMDAPPPPGDSADGGRLSLKALQEQMDRRLAEERKAWQAKFDEERKARGDAEARERMTRGRAQVEAMLGKHIGSDNPNVGPLMSHLFDVGKRFAIGDDGSVRVRFKGEFGEEEAGLEDGFKRLLDADLKPYLPARNGGLPPASMGARGVPVSQGPRPAFYNPIMREFAKGVEERNPALAEALNRAAVTDPNAK